MSYIVLLDPGTRRASVIKSSHGFPEEFTSYEAAKQEGELYQMAADCRNFEVFGKCTDQRNHII